MLPAQYHVIHYILLEAHNEAVKYSLEWKVHAEGRCIEQRVVAWLITIL